MSKVLQVFSIAAMVVLSIQIFILLVRCIQGPRISDRIVAVNMIGTLAIIIVEILAVFLGEGYLADIALVYAMLSYLAVILLCKVYTGVYREGRHEEQGGE